MTAAQLFHARVLGGARQRVGRRDRPCYAPWLDRGPSLAALADAPLPEPRSYTWEYSNPNPWYERNASGPDDHEPAEGIVASQGVEVADFDAAGPRERGIVEAHLNTTIDRRRYPLAAVNDVLLRRGVVIEVPAQAREADIELGSLGGGFERVLLIVGEGAEATLVERPAAPTHRVVECLIRTGGSLRHTRLQRAADSLEYHLVSTRVDARARYRFAQYAQGAAMRRNDIHVEAAGDGADIEIHGAWHLSNRQHLDTQINVHHRFGGGTSRQTVRGVVDDRAKAVFNGRIHIAPHAQRTDAALSTKHMLLSPLAQAYAKPELEIYANDVQCAHGATMGQIDGDALFYLRSRGIDEPGARDLLIAGFLEEALAGLQRDEARALLSPQVRERLA